MESSWKLFKKNNIPLRFPVTTLSLLRLIIRNSKLKIMKKLIISSIVILFAVSLYAQPKSIDQLYYNYKGEEGVVALRIPGFVMKLAGSIADLDHNERQLLRSMRSITVLTIEDKDLYQDVNFTEEVDLSRMKGEYHLLLEVHDGDEDVMIIAREKNGKIRDLIVLVGGDENVMVHVRGRMNSNLLESLADVAGIDELSITRKIG